MDAKKGYDLPVDIENSIIHIAKRYDFSKLMLFGSRARGDNRDVSDIDLAVFGGNSNDIADFREELLDTRKVYTLLLFDVVNMDSDMINPDLYHEVMKEGIVLWEA